MLICHGVDAFCELELDQASSGFKWKKPWTWLKGVPRPRLPKFLKRKSAGALIGGSGGIRAEDAGGLEDPAREAWVAKVRALSGKTTPTLSKACKDRGIEIYYKENGKTKSRKVADLRNDLYDVDPSLYEIDVLPASCPRKIPWLVDQSLYNVKQHYEERMETSLPPQNAGESYAQYTKRIFQLVLDLGSPEDLKKRKPGEVKKFEDETFRCTGNHGDCVKCGDPVKANPWNCVECGVNCASCVHEEGECQLEHYRCKPCLAKYGTPVFTTTPPGGSFIHGDEAKQKRGRIFINALGADAPAKLIRIAKATGSIETYKLKVKKGCFSEKAACRRWTLAVKSMETELMDQSKRPFEGIVVDFEKAMEAAPAGADALDVAKAMVKEVHPGYNIIVVALDEKLVRTRAQG